MRVCEHDSSFSYFDGNSVRYLKTERKFQEKHHGVNSLTDWENIIYREWGITSNDIDEIAIVIDVWRYNLSILDDGFYPSVNFNDLHANCKVTRINHHYAHHLSCWPIIKDPHKFSGFSLDGYGDHDVAWTVFKDRRVKDQGSKISHGSIGLSMSMLGAVMELKGDGLDIAGKVMSLQSYGNMDHVFYRFLQQFDMTDIDHIFLPTYYGHQWNRKLDWLHTVHEYVGNLLVNFFKKYFDRDETILYTGGVALNVNWNTKLKKYFNIVIPPHTNDEGLSLGALEFLRQKHNLDYFNLENFPFCQTDEAPTSVPSQVTINKTVELLKQQKIVGWYQGHGELGPRALGHRSILADPRNKDMRDKVNQIKQREGFRPFGCSTIDSSFSKSPFMLYAENIDTQSYPAVSHIDGTCRHQFVESGHLLQLLQQFQTDTGCGTLLNTSLNINGKPLASYISNAHEIFNNTQLDAIVIGDEIIQK